MFKWKTIPASRAVLQLRVSPADATWACVCPVLALLLRDTVVTPSGYLFTASLYWGCSAALSIFACLVFKLHNSVKRYFSVHDAFDVLKAVALAELLICLVLFSVSRLEGIPRSTLFIHALLLGSGLLAIRALARVLELNRNIAARQMHAASEHIIIIGANQLSSEFVNLLKACATAQRVVGILDDRPEMTTRTISGVPILGGPHDLATVIDEFAVHGVLVARVVVAGNGDVLSKPAADEVARICEQRKIRLEFVRQMLGLDRTPVVPNDQTHGARGGSEGVVAISPYHRLKRIVDFAAAAVGIIVFLPLFLCVSLLVLLDLGLPILFWQQRVGKDGHPFLVYKFRTMRTPFDRDGQIKLDLVRPSLIGTLLRKTGLDELPQLLNVLVGDMSLIGPRPLLPVDQPKNPSIRLMVRPGITGWAQVNGAKLLTPSEKNKLDEWYIRHASPLLDLRIILMTLNYVLTGERRPNPDLLHASVSATLSKNKRVASELNRKIA